MTDAIERHAQLDLCAQGWRQGSVLPRDLALDLSTEANFAVALAALDLLVLVSHDCDICQGDIDKEPWAELLVIRGITRRPLGDRSYMKSPRVLEFEAHVGTSTGFYRVSASERWFAPRERLSGSSPSGHLGTQPHDLIPSWLSRRYIRQAFPDAFNDRLKAASKDIARHLSAPGGDSLYAIFLVLDDEEFPPETEYRVVLRGTMLEADFADHVRRTEAQLALDGVASAMDGCAGIVVTDSALVPESEVTLHDVRLMKRWDPFDSLSLPDESDAASRVRPPN